MAAVGLAVATTAVVVMPVAAVWWLRSRGAIASPWAGIGLAMALSLVVSFIGAFLLEEAPRSE